MKRLLLISRQKPPEYENVLDHCEAEILSFLGRGIKKVLFIPFALYDTRAEVERIGARLSRMGYELEGLDLEKDAKLSIDSAQAIYMGGGNTFRLLDVLSRNGLLTPIRQKVLAGVPYIGISAGSVLACPTIQTTNNMAIVSFFLRLS